LIRLLLVITPTRAVVDLIVLLFDTSLVGDNTNKGGAPNHRCVPMVYVFTNHQKNKFHCTQPQPAKRVQQ
jgi:hypothetical protein